MKAEIKNNLENPGQLEKLYRSNRNAFKRQFNLLYPEISNSAAAQIWNARINFEQESNTPAANNELAFVIIAACIAGLIAKIPDLSAIQNEYFYTRHIAFIVFPALIAYFAWKHMLSVKRIISTIVCVLIPLIYINLLPNDPQSDTLILACIHLPLCLWFILGYTFAGKETGSSGKRLDFLRYNGDLAVMTAIILAAGMLMTGMTIWLFELIGLKIEHFYMQNIGIWGLAAAPVAATYLVQNNPSLVGRVSPVIARIFTPLVFVMLVIYLTAMIFTAKNPYNDREFLLTFNVLLIGVMALILFSVAERRKHAGTVAGTILLLGLSLVTIVVNGIALSAILLRITEGGITPNRLAVLGGNMLILVHLVSVAYRLFQTAKNQDHIDAVENSIASFLPVYAAWTVFMTFIVPVLFHFK